jgi:hypothetical protein
LSAPLPQELIDELRWQDEMAENTLQMLWDDTIVMDSVNFFRGSEEGGRIKMFAV